MAFILEKNFILSAVICLVIVVPCLHKIREGHVGVYWRGGALLNEITDPGFHLKLPWLTSVSQIQITLQTDRVTDIPCGTSNGVTIIFDRIEVVNRLSRDHVIDVIRQYGVNYDSIWIFDRIHHLINQFCSAHTLQEVYIDLFSTLDERLTEELQRDCDKWNTGIQIIAARVTKPRIPESVRKNYEMVEVEKAKVRVAAERQKVVEKEAETERLKATIEATKTADVSKINMDRELLVKKARQKIELIEDQMHLDRQKKRAESALYKQKRVSEANELKLSSGFIQLETFRLLESRPKVFFGKSLASVLVSDPLFQVSPIFNQTAQTLADDLETNAERVSEH
eukprot:TRINITY_DN16445_c0_g2_i1.p2 TRINITY_DN16445_c0_g2~~TRINITY_DN16445_c0_g2_i1.p2  ORF type:complete len:340 (-),score=91.14 TRINITY_DN16445_c0_g2_i1:1102-2121(-)